MRTRSNDLSHQGGGVEFARRHAEVAADATTSLKKRGRDHPGDDLLSCSNGADSESGRCPLSGIMTYTACERQRGPRRAGQHLSPFSSPSCSPAASPWVLRCERDNCWTLECRKARQAPAEPRSPSRFVAHTPKMPGPPALAVAALRWTSRCVGVDDACSSALCAATPLQRRTNTRV